ncbi:MAG: CoA-binding protein [Pseudomonadales bacterium]|nr:CoA-binding protein [Pseudomonadales bacterium]
MATDDHSEMKNATTDNTTIRKILDESKTIAIVGLSGNWYRPSFFAAKYLLERGFNVVPVNPNYEEILGQKCYPNLESIPDKVDVVDLFQKVEQVPKFVQPAIDIGAKVLWLQLGIVHEKAAAQAHNAGLKVVMDRCMKIEYARLFGGLNWAGVNTGIISAKRPRRLP